MKWIYIDLLDNYSTNEWKNLILIDGSSRITNFELKNRDFQFQIIFIHHWNSKFWQFYEKIKKSMSIYIQAHLQLHEHSWIKCKKLNTRVWASCK